MLFGGRMVIFGKNSVLEAVRSEKTFNEILIEKGLKDRAIQEIIDFARENGVKLDFVSKEILQRKVRAQGQRPNLQGVVAEIIDFEYSSLDELLSGSGNLILILDGVTDPHNLGAIVRTAECAGANGIIIPKRRACQVNETVVKTSAGAISNVKVARVGNLQNAISELKENGFWIYAVEVGGKDIFSSNLSGKVALVLGSEGEGVGRLVKESCDGIVTIPMFGKINSLNVSVAAAISTFEVVRQRTKKE